MTLSDLITKLEQAEGPSRELDAAVAAEFRIGPVSKPPEWLSRWEGPFVPHPKFPGKIALLHTDGALGMHWNAPALTASVDAALALIGEKLPRWTTDVHTADASPEAYPVLIRLYRGAYGDWTAELLYQHPKIEAREISAGCSRSPAIALTDALLRALRSQEPST